MAALLAAASALLTSGLSSFAHMKKAVGGNKAAGTRVRKAMQDIKNSAQAVRKRILDIREKEGDKP